MDKSAVKIVLYSAVGVSLVILLITWMGLALNFASMAEAAKHVSGAEEKNTVRFIQWSSLALFFIALPFLTGSVMSAVRSSSSVHIATLSAGGLLAVVCIVFMAVAGRLPYESAEINTEAFTAATAYQAVLIQLLVPVFVMGAAVAVLFVAGIKKRRAEAASAEGGSL